MAIDPRLAQALHLRALRRGQLESEEHAPHVAFQTSTLAALLDGAYDGDLTVGELRRHGDLGLGTFDGLDGEMIVLDGAVWRARADGTVAPAGDDERTPFAVVVPFDAAGAATVTVEEPLDEQQLVALAREAAPLAAAAEDGLRPRSPGDRGPARAGDDTLALRFDGRLEMVRARSVPRQRKPYPPLAEAAATQREFALADVEGSLVGFVFPSWAGGVELPGLHLHAITADRARGGHVLAARVGPGVLRVDPVTDLHLELPAGVELPSGEIDDAALQRIEHG